MRRILVLSLLAAALLGCGSSSIKKTTRELPARIPVAVVVEREVAGAVSGQLLQHPSAMATDFRGDTYLCDEGNNRIVKFNATLQPIVDRGGFGSQPGLFNAPRAIAVDNQLNVWVCDAGNRRLVRLDGELNFVDEIGFTSTDDPLQFGVPSGIAVTTYGSLWVSDIERDRVAVFDNVGQFEKFVGDFGAGGGPVRDPEGATVSDDELFYVCDAGNHRVMAYDSYGTDLRSMTDGQMIRPIAVTLDRRQSLWVLDQVSRRLFCFDREGANLAEGGLELIGNDLGAAVLSGLTILTDSTALISDSDAGRLLYCKLIFK
jgi:DNA-binding beta-propeller fold protein YncE